MAVSRGSRTRDCRFADVRTRRERAENPWRSFQFSGVCAAGLRLAARCGNARGGRREVGFIRRDLGSVAPRIDGRIHRGDDSQRRTANSACICGNAPAVEHETHVRGPGTRQLGLHAACFAARSLHIKGYAAWAWSVLPFSALCRARGTDSLRDQYPRNIHSRTQSRTETAAGRWACRRRALKQKTPATFVSFWKYCGMYAETPFPCDGSQHHVLSSRWKAARSRARWKTPLALSRPKPAAISRNCLLWSLLRRMGTDQRVRAALSRNFPPDGNADRVSRGRPGAARVACCGSRRACLPIVLAAERFFRL